MNLYLNLLSLLFLRFCSSESISLKKPKPLWNETDLDRLKKDLFTNYNKLSIPSKNKNSINIKLALGFTHIETNEMESTVIIKGWLRMIWIDQNLIWNISAYNGLNFAKIANHEIWQPDLYLLNSILGVESVTSFSDTHIILSSIGSVLFMPIIKLNAICKFNFRYWPFDTQNCRFDIASRLYNKKEVTFTLYNVKFKNTKRSSSWHVRNATSEIMTKYYPQYQQPHSLAQFNFTISRRSDSYTAVIVTPAVVSSIFIMVQFWLQPDSHVRLILNGVTSITLVMHLAYFNHHTFGIGSNTPLIVMFYGMNLLMVCCSIAGTCFGYALAHMKQTAYLPWLFHKLLSGYFGKLLFLEYKSGNRFPRVKPVISYDENNEQMKNYEIEEEWLFASAINRILFLIYLIIFLTISVVYITFVCRLSYSISHNDEIF